MEQIWHHTFYNFLRINPEEHPIFLTLVPVAPKPMTERVVQVMFETFNVRYFYMKLQAVLSLHSTGRANGLVLHIGDSVIHAVPIYEGYALPDAVQTAGFGGRDLNVYLEKLLRERGYFLNKANGEEVYRKIKESYCFVALDYEEEMRKIKEKFSLLKTYKLDDGNSINILKERFKCPEVLFKPSLIGKEKENGIHNLLLSAVGRSNREIRYELCPNIVLSGGLSLLQGLAERLTLEMKKLLMNIHSVLTGHLKVEVFVAKKYSAWVGGSSFSSLAANQQMWITREDYNEYGPKIVHRKCF